MEWYELIKSDSGFWETYQLFSNRVAWYLIITTCWFTVTFCFFLLGTRFESFRLQCSRSQDRRGIQKKFRGRRPTLVANGPELEVRLLRRRAVESIKA